MNTITTKYAKSDKVWYATTTQITKQHPCPDCLGTRIWEANSPGGGKYTFRCPRCAASYRSNSDLNLQYAEFVPATQLLTIGSVRVDTHDASPVSYMCVETGVGGGSIYREEQLFPTQEEALAGAEILAQKQKTEIPWVAELYNKTLEISEYQLTDAINHIEETKNGVFRYRVEDLVEALKDMKSLEDAQTALDDFVEKVGW